MEFQRDNVEEFLSIFSEAGPRIDAFEGCFGVELLRDINADHIFFTYSRWEDEASLEAYRQSDLFKTTWSKTRALFSDRAQAWSCITGHQKL
jgi:heme-degrading monooxygenase HmoA